MEEDEDDFYGGGGGVKQEDDDQMQTEDDEKNQTMDVSEDGQGEDDDDDDDDDSDDDVQFTLEKPDGTKAQPPPGSKAARQQAKSVATTKKEDRAKSNTPVKTETVRAGSAAPPTAVKGTLTHNGKEGKDFPEIRTSKLDVDQTPIWPANGKQITELDIDADLAEHSKPWRLPGTDQTDFFNYGFDEYTWVQYSVRQQTMGNTITDLKAQDAQMKNFFGGGGGLPGGGGGSGGMPPGMPGMPAGMDVEQMAREMGIPADFVHQMMQQGGMPGMGMVMGPQQGGPQGQFNPGGDFGSVQNSISPGPQSNQGFQPPQGPSGGQQGGFNMEGFSQQQLEIMNQQGNMHGGANRGGRGRRGRW